MAEPTINISNPVMQAILGKRDAVHVVVDEERRKMTRLKLSGWRRCQTGRMSSTRVSRTKAYRG